MQLIEDLTIPNTFAVPASAAMGTRATSIADVQAAQRRAKQAGLSFIALGEGSNVLPHSTVNRFVCLMQLRGLDVVEQSSTNVVVRVAAGENWHTLVQHSLAQGWFGLENLSLIPGSVGAAPVQNIGAYGVELSRFVKSVEVLDPAGRPATLTRSECKFAYRDSLFKSEPGLVIVAVKLELSTRPAIVVDYPELQDALAGTPAPTPAQVAQAVTQIRRAKLPDPEQTPNAGSFFKNPVVSAVQAADLVAEHPHLNAFTVPEGMKLSAAQLIDLAGWKSKPDAEVACWPRQPLVLINTGKATARSVLRFAEQIRVDIERRYGVQLELEPSVLS